MATTQCWQSGSAQMLMVVRSVSDKTFNESSGLVGKREHSGELVNLWCFTGAGRSGEFD